MVITVEDDSQTLLELLWIREAWQLHSVGDDLPPTLVDTPTIVDGQRRVGAPIAAWQDAWPGMWDACLRHAAAVRDPKVFTRLHSSETGSDERARLLNELSGPSWRDEFGSDALTPEAAQWMHMLFRQRVDRSRQPVSEQPEHAALEALVPAWRRGLTKLVQIPCRGTFTRVVGAHALLVTGETRADPTRYRKALTEFH